MPLLSSPSPTRDDKERRGKILSNMVLLVCRLIGLLLMKKSYLVVRARLELSFEQALPTPATKLTNERVFSLPESAALEYLRKG